MSVAIAPQMVVSTIFVTKEDLAHDRLWDAYQHPLAWAINQHLAPEYYTAVFQTHYAIRHMDSSLEAYPKSFDWPPQARSLMYAIDARCRIHLPFKVKLPLPVHALRQTPRILPLP